MVRVLVKPEVDLEADVDQNAKEDVQPDFASCIDACAANSGYSDVDYNQDTKSCGYISQNLASDR